MAQPKMMVLDGGTVAAWFSIWIARAARVGGTLTKTPALAEAGGFLYISQGLGQLAMLPINLNDKLLAPIENVPLLGAALEAIPFAGVIIAASAVAAPLLAIVALMQQIAEDDKLVERRH